MVRFISWPPYSQGKNLHYPLNRWLSRFPSLSGQLGTEKLLGSTGILIMDCPASNLVNVLTKLVKPPPPQYNIPENPSSGSWCVFQVDSWLDMTKIIFNNCFVNACKSMSSDVDMYPLKTATEVGIWQVANSLWQVHLLAQPNCCSSFFARWLNYINK